MGKIKEVIGEFYIFEILLFSIGIGFLYFAYKLPYTFHNSVGAAFIMFGFVLGYIQKRM